MMGTKRADTAWFVRSLGRNRRVFQAALCCFVVLSSFLYGLVEGLGNKGAQARASLALPEGGEMMPLSLAESEVLRSKFFPARGLSFFSLGSQVKLNSVDADLFSFFSKRPIREILSEQSKNWESSGRYVFGKGTARRGFAAALDRMTGERFIITAWKVPPTLRKIVSGGMPVQGIISRALGDLDKQDSELGPAAGIVPDVPLMPDGEASVVFSSGVGPQTSFTGVYRNPGSVEDSLHFYRRTLGALGWKEIARGVFENASFENGGELGAHVKFELGREEVTMLFTPLLLQEKAAQGEGPATVVFVARSPKLVE